MSRSRCCGACTLFGWPTCRKRWSAAVLNDMAFNGAGPLFVYAFALIQGTLFEKTENLLYVLVVHLIVDYFLFQEIVTSYYPASAHGGIAVPRFGSATQSALSRLDRPKSSVHCTATLMRPARNRTRIASLG